MADVKLSTALAYLATIVCGGTGAAASWRGSPLGLIVETSEPSLELALSKALENGPCVVITATGATASTGPESFRAAPLRWAVSVGIMHIPGLHTPPAASIEIAEDFARMIHGASVIQGVPGMQWRVSSLVPFPDEAPMAGWQVLCEAVFPLRSSSN
jgi:hypothetical protein